MGETSFKRWQERQLTRVTIMPPAWPGIVFPPIPSNILICSWWWLGWQPAQSPAACSEPLLVEGVLDAEVAAQAVDGVFGHVLGVHERVVVDPRQIAFAVVADQAALAGHLALAANHVGVAIDAIDALLVRQLVGELDAAAQIVFLLGNLMAVRAGGQAFVERLVLEVAEEAGRGGHRHVFALHDLAVATGAAQLLAAAEFAHVRGMIEMDALDTPRGPRAGGFRGSPTGGNWRRAPRPPAGAPRSW